MADLTEQERGWLHDGVEHTEVGQCWRPSCDGSLPWQVEREARQRKIMQNEQQRVIDSLLERAEQAERALSDWPAAAYVYMTWGYALARAQDQATQRRQRVYVRQATFEGRPCWITSWDPRNGGGEGQ